MKIYDYGKWTLVELCYGVYLSVETRWYKGHCPTVYEMVKHMRASGALMDYRVYFLNNGERDEDYQLW